MHLLHLEDSDVDAELVAHTVIREWPDCRINHVRSRVEYLDALKTCAYDLIIADYALEDYDGLAAFDVARRQCPDKPFIFVSGAMGEDNAIEAMKRGAADYVMKDRPGRLVSAIRQALVLAKEKRLRARTEAEVATHARLSDLLVQVASELFVSASKGTSLENVWQRISAGVEADGYLYASSGDESAAFQIDVIQGLDPLKLGELTGMPFANAIRRGAQPGHVFSLDELQQVHPTVAAALSAQGATSCSCHVLRTGGRVWGLLALMSRTRDRFTATEVRFLRTATDLVAAHLERNRLLEEVRRALEDAEQANRAKDNFLAALSHELRTPLNPVLLLASDAAANPQLAPDVRDDFAAIASHVTLEARLIDDLLELTRMARNEVSLELTTTDLHTIIAEAVRVITPEAAEKGITIDCKFDATSGLVSGEAARLQQVCWKLLANAVKFSPSDAQIAVRTESTVKGTITVTITDPGIGLTAAELERVFDPFVRGEHAAQGSGEYGGLGLGLGIARRIAELHGGTIRASSPGRGQGSTFVLELPQLNAAPRETTAASTVANPTAVQENRPRHLLLVEDHAATRESLRRLLERRGYVVGNAANVAQARALAQQQPFDLVLSDIGLPDGNGYDLMAELHRTRGLQGIALTGFEVDAARLAAAGFISHLTKPINITLLVDLIEDAIERAAPVSNGPPATT